MSETPNNGIASWVDLTVADAENIRDFYEAVAGWTSQPVEIGDYNDFNMIPAGSDTPVAGICHARGLNANLPPQWLIYIPVDNLEHRLAECRRLGGEILSDRDAGSQGRFAVIRDPAGASIALFQPA